MKLYLFEQKNKMSDHLQHLKTEMVMLYDLASLKEKITTIEIKTKKNIEEINFDFLFAYDIFPNNIMTSKTQWQEEKRKMQIGDTIVQQVFIPPVKLLSQKIIFGVRIKEIIDQTHRKGFSYETLNGHVEKGISTFTVEQDNQKLIFKIHTYSSPGNFLTKILGPIFSIPYQAFCTKSALIHVKKQIEMQP